MGGDARIDGYLKYISPNDLHSVWGEVREGLEKVRLYSAEAWLPEDIYHSLKMNESTLHVCDDGFVVLQRQKQLDGEAVHIWAAFSKSKHPLKTYIAEIEQMARNIGAKRITLSSQRDWRKYFNPANTIYQKELL